MGSTDNDTLRRTADTVKCDGREKGGGIRERRINLVRKMIAHQKWLTLHTIVFPTYPSLFCWYNLIPLFTLLSGKFFFISDRIPSSKLLTKENFFKLLLNYMAKLD